MPVKMIKPITVVLTALILTLTIPSFFNISGMSTWSESSRETTLNDIKIHFHREGLMDTNPPDTNTPSIEYLRDGTGTEFSLNPSLYSELYVKGQVKVDDKDALLLVFNVNYIPIGGSTASITINVIDDSTTIALNSFTLPHETSYRIPFTGSKTDHTFSANSVIRVNITASVTGSPTVNIRYDHDTYPAYLYFTCYQIGTMTLGAFHHDGSSGEFMPNAPSNRVISLQGEVEDAFGGYDIDSVILNCPTLSEFPTDANANIYAAVNEKAKYYYNWSYPAGLAPGKYDVEATIYDNSGNTFSSTTMFTIADHGVHLHIVEPEKADEKGKSVVFDLTVTNIGGKSDTITLHASPSLSWSTHFDTNAIGLAANQTGDVKLTVEIPTSAGDDQSNTITITATSQGDNTKQMSLEAIATARPTTGFTFELLSSGTQEIEDGNTATYNFKLVNTGQQAETFVISIPSSSSPSSGWQVTLEVEGGTLIPSSSSYIRYEKNVTANGQLTPKLKVTAVSPGTNSQRVDVTASLKSDPSKTQTLTTTTSLLLETVFEIKLLNDPASAEVEDRTATVPSYSSIEYTIEVYNKGTDTDISFDVTPPGLDWTYTTPSQISVEENTKREVSFTVKPPSSIEANTDTGYPVKFKATSEDDISVYMTLDLTAKVSQFYRLEVEVDEDQDVGGSGLDVSYRIAITNLGNGDDEVSVIVSQNDWDFEWSSSKPTGGTVGDVLEIVLEPNEIVTLTFTLTSPSDARNGNKDETILIIRSGEFHINDELTYQRIPITTTVEKGSSEALKDAFMDLWILVILVVAVIIIAVFIKIKLKEKERT